MAGMRELGFPRTDGLSLRELAARTTLRNVRSKGHIYVDLREDGKRFVFFCTLCLAPCYNDTVLDDHLNGNLHRERYAAAKATLLGSNPFPFSDGVLFFHGLCEQDKQLAVVNSNQDRILNTNNYNNKLIVASDSLRILDNVEDNVHLGSEVIVHKKNSDSHVCVLGGEGKSLNVCGKSDYVLVPGVVRNDEITDLEIRLIGFGEITARMCETDETPGSRIISMWCAWLGGENPRSNGYGDVVPEYDFGIVTFSYKYSLGRIDLLEGLGPRLTSSPYSESENGEGTIKKRKKSFSDHEDDYLASNSPSSNLVLHQYDDQIRHGKLVSSRSARREMRRQQRLAANRMCDLCQQKILPGKDVSTLLNMKTGRLVCSSRNVNGAFHLFHTSCLIHWILLCEFEIWKNQFTRNMTLDSQEPRRGPKRKGRTKKTEIQTDVTLDGQEPRRGPKRKGRAKKNEIQTDDGQRATRNKIFSAFCPECQGTGSNVEEDQLEHPNIFLSEMFNYKIKLSDAHRAWMKRPEILENCSTGLIFSRHSEDPTQENVVPMKLLHFYRADVQN